MHQIGRAQPPTGDQDRNADNSLKRRLQWWNASASALRTKLTPPAAAGLARCVGERRRPRASVCAGRRVMKSLTATPALLIWSPAAAQECQTCSSADACIQTYVKAASEAQRATKVAIRDWQENLDKKTSTEFSSRGMA